MNSDDIDKLCDRYETILQRGEYISPEEFVSKEGVPSGARLLEALRLLAVDYQENSPRESLRETDGLVRVGSRVSNYKLLQEIGHGGMGVVFMAEQTKPVSRTVALKVVKPGMDSRQILARFEAERQALALMEHNNIARVLDAGTTDGGHPYFVMEYVKGVPITDYCDQQHLSLADRLKLFVSVCEAVQHAHQKGIVHRDVKPSNVLVAMYDDRAVAKVIDFGLAKAFGQRLTDKTLFTRHGHIVGTVEYMSPEQAKFNQLDVDTRTDVYSLGVLLYELVAGELPFDRERFRSADDVEIKRIIGEEEPPRPSAKLESSNSALAIASNRGMDLKKLSGSIKGELDWVVMKALEKDRTRRYQTAYGLAADVQRFLNDEPVSACPPSLVYQWKRFVRRNRAAIATAAAILICLVAGLSSTSWMWILSSRHARQATEEAERARQAERLADSRLQEVVKARESARDLIDQVVSAHTRDLFEASRSSGNHDQRQLLSDLLDIYEGVASDSEESQSTHLAFARRTYLVGLLRLRLGFPRDAAESFEKAQKFFEELVDNQANGEKHVAALAECLSMRSTSLYRAFGDGADEEIEALIEKIKLLAHQFPGTPGIEDTLLSVDHERAIQYKEMERYQEALELSEKNVSRQRKIVQSGRNDADSMLRLAAMLLNSSSAAGGLRNYDLQRQRREEYSQITETLLQNDPTSNRLSQYAAFYLNQGISSRSRGESERTNKNFAQADHELRQSERQLQKAEDLIRRCIALYPADPNYQRTLGRIHIHHSHLEIDRRNVEKAKSIAKNGVAVFDNLVRNFPDDYRYLSGLASSKEKLARALMMDGSYAEAFRIQTDSLGLLREAESKNAEPIWVRKNYQDVYKHRSEAALALGRYRNVVDDCKATLQLNPSAYEFAWIHSICKRLAEKRAVDEASEILQFIMTKYRNPDTQLLLENLQHSGS